MLKWQCYWLTVRFLLAWQQPLWQGTCMHGGVWHTSFRPPTTVRTLVHCVMKEVGRHLCNKHAVTRVRHRLYALQTPHRPTSFGGPIPHARRGPHVVY